MFTQDGVFITTWGSRGNGDEQFVLPRGIAVDASGNVYVADTFNHRIQKFAQDKTAPTISGYINNQKLKRSTDVIIVSVGDAQSGVDWNSLNVVVDGKRDVTSGIQKTMTGFQIPASLLPNGKHTITVSVSDMAGNGANAKWSVQVTGK